jgi:hypothetical protein
MSPLHAAIGDSVLREQRYPFREGRWVSAEPADVFAALLELALRRALDAAVEAFADVTLGGDLRCESADPAADFDVLLESELRNTFDAAVAARLLVTSGLLAIASSCGWCGRLLDHVDRRSVIEY